ncbi:ribosomal RNA small subunit methyltransferase H [Bryobacterales bacterium F-183]|nr:ribosomal RNA small subunit methyltransferase H [Bryobacterales bacterium F-183]
MEHIPVLLNECLDGLQVRPDGVYLDCTCGLGGHTGAIASQLTTGFVISNDRDEESLAKAKENTAAYADRIRFHHGRFSELPKALSENGVKAVDGVLADLGVSRYQLTTADRGFSFMADGPLDMRMSRSQETTAADIVNFSSPLELGQLIATLGEERRWWRRIAEAIVRGRPVHTTGQLATLIERAVPRTSRLHPATQTFQALRLAVNREPEELDALLEWLPSAVKPAGGRAAVISFMSLDDRKVKVRFQSLAKAGEVTLINKKVIVPGDEEIRNNPASRSAKLRVFEKL